MTNSRRGFLAVTAATVATASLAGHNTRAEQDIAASGLAEVSGTEHWTVKRVGADDVKLFLWRKQLKNPASLAGVDMRRGTILFVHGSSVSATPVFDLQIPGKPDA